MMNEGGFFPSGKGPPRTTSMCVDLSISAESPPPHSRRVTLAMALCVAAVANAFVPAVLLSDANLFGNSNPHDRALVAVIVMVVYATALLLLLLNADVGYASGYLVSTGASATLVSVLLTFASVEPAGWDRDQLYAVVVVLAGFTFAVSSNIVFLVASVRYARAINLRLHLGGFLFGAATSLALLFLYSSILG